MAKAKLEVFSSEDEADVIADLEATGALDPDTPVDIPTTLEMAGGMDNGYVICADRTIIDGKMYKAGDIVQLDREVAISHQARGVPLTRVEY